VGLNITTPHKIEAAQLVDHLEPTVKLIGAINTIHNRQGELIGYNTDGVGALKSLRERVSNLGEKEIVMLGAGGAARAIAFSLVGQCKSLTILNRTERKAKELANSLRSLGLSAQGVGLTSKILHKSLSRADILIHTTTVGMAPHTEHTLVKKKYLHPHLTVFDIVYNPPRTRLLREARAVGAHVIEGIDMLVYQGATSFKIWTGRDAPVDVMRRAVRAELSRREALMRS
jgi:shikimate dehydrogenase